MKRALIFIPILSMACRTSGPSAREKGANPPTPGAERAVTCDTKFNSLDPPAALCSVWGTDVDAALKASHASSKPTLLFFCAQWTSACKPMRQETLENTSVLQELTKHYYLAYVDATDVDDSKTNAILRRFEVTTLPHLLVVNPTGAVTLRVDRYATRDELLTMLRGNSSNIP